MALCVQADIEKRLQWDITTEPDPVVTMLIADATSLIESELGRPAETAGSRVETFDGGFWSLFLTAWPVTAVASVVEDGVTLTVTTDYKWSASGKLIRVSGGYQTWWKTTKPDSIVVTFTGGYVAATHVSEFNHLGAICAEMVARAFLKGAANAVVPAGVSGQISSVTLADSDSVTYTDTSGASGSSSGAGQFLYLEEDEIRQLHLPKFHRPRFGFA